MADIPAVLAGATFSAAEQAYIESGGATDLGDGGTPTETQAPGPAPTEPPAATKPPAVTEPSLTGHPVTEVPGGTPGETQVPEVPTDSRTVPLAALQEERELHKESRAQIKELTSNFQTLMTQFNTMLETMGKGGKAEEPTKPGETFEIPSIDKDPVGHFQAQITLLNNAIKAIGGKQEEGEKVQATVSEITQLRSRAHADEVEFTKTTPDYQEALNHMIAMRRMQLSELGVTEEAKQNEVLFNESLGIANRAYKDGKKPPAVLYNIAKSFGYVPKAPATTAAAMAETPPDAVAAATAIAKRNAGQEQAGTSLGGRGGAPAPVTAERAAQMSEKDYAKLLSTEAGMALLGA